MNLKQNGQTRYKEVQRFSDFWLWALITVVSVLCLITGYRIINSIQSGGESSLPAVLVLLVTGVGVPAFLGICKLTVEVRGDGVYFKFSPFHREYRKILFSKIQRFEAITYRPIVDYGGWGIRYGRKGLAYNTGGNRGVLFELANGRTILLGSRDAEQFERVLKEIIS